MLSYFVKRSTRKLDDLPAPDVRKTVLYWGQEASGKTGLLLATQRSLELKQHGFQGDYDVTVSRSDAVAAIPAERTNGPPVNKSAHTERTHQPVVAPSLPADQQSPAATPSQPYPASDQDGQEESVLVADSEVETEAAAGTAEIDPDDVPPRAKEEPEQESDQAEYTEENEPDEEPTEAAGDEDEAEATATDEKPQPAEAELEGKPVKDDLDYGPSGQSDDGSAEAHPTDEYRPLSPFEFEQENLADYFWLSSEKATADKPRPRVDRISWKVSVSPRNKYAARAIKQGKKTPPFRIGREGSAAFDLDLFVPNGSACSGVKTLDFERLESGQKRNPLEPLTQQADCLVACLPIVDLRPQPVARFRELCEDIERTFLSRNHLKSRTVVIALTYFEALFVAGRAVGYEQASRRSLALSIIRNAFAKSDLHLCLRQLAETATRLDQLSRSKSRMDVFVVPVSGYGFLRISGSANLDLWSPISVPATKDELRRKPFAPTSHFAPRTVKEENIRVAQNLFDNEEDRAQDIVGRDQWMPFHAIDPLLIALLGEGGTLGFSPDEILSEALGPIPNARLA